MAISKSKLSFLTKGKSSKPVKLGASTSSTAVSPLLTGQKKTYKKKSAQISNAIPSFGATGLTGES